MQERLRIPTYKPGQQIREETGLTLPEEGPVNYSQLQRNFFEIEQAVNSITTQAAATRSFFFRAPAGSWIRNPFNGPASGQGFGNANPIAYTNPFPLFSDCHVSGITIHIDTTWQGTIHAALYRDNGSGYPGALVQNAGPVPLTTGDKFMKFTAVSCTADIYWPTLVFLNSVQASWGIEGFIEPALPSPISFASSASWSYQSRVGYQNVSTSWTSSFIDPFPASTAAPVSISPQFGLKIASVP